MSGQLPRARRSGFVTVAGRPNSGKSTLVNLLVGEKISIVTDKPQTTRGIVRGIATRPEGQIVFLDTPGVHKPIHKMNDKMMKSVRSALGEGDVLLLVVDASVSFGRGDEFVLDLVRPVAVPKVLVLNKIDKIKKFDLLPQIERYSKAMPFEEVIPMSARNGENAEILWSALFRLVPEGEAMYPEDQLSDQHERTFAAEIIREKLIQGTHDELPYSTAVVIDRFEESDPVGIYATIVVERDSQKGIVIGKGGLLLKDVGTAARLDLERFLGKKVFLTLRVKVTKGWRDDDATLRNLGID